MNESKVKASKRQFSALQKSRRGGGGAGPEEPYAYIKYQPADVESYALARLDMQHLHVAHGHQQRLGPATQVPGTRGV